MAHAAPRLQPLKFPTLPANETSDQKYWKKFKSHLIVKEYASVSHVNFSATSPHDFAVTSSTRVQIYSSRTRTTIKTISRFKDTTYSGELRPDGKLLVAGDATGLIQIFDTSSRAILRSIDSHKYPARVTKFSPTSSTTLLSASDDKTLKLWDIPTQTAMNTFTGHEDYVRTAAFSSNLVISGSYDGTVKIWDSRANISVTNLIHGDGIDCVFPLIGGTRFLSAGGPLVKVWDIIAGKCFKELRNHQKAVTTITSDSNCERILTGGLDGHMKIYDVKDWKVVHGVKYSAPILSLALSPDDKHIVCGMTSGLLSIRTRQNKPQNSTLPKKPKPTSYQRLTRGADYKGDKEDLYVEESRTKRLKPYDKALRAYRYDSALDMVLQESKDPLITLTLFSELMHRNGLQQALHNRDDHQLEPVLRFLIRYITDSRFVNIVIEVALTIIELYGNAIGQSTLTDGLIQKLRMRVSQEVERAKEACRTEGMLELLFAGSSIR
ncbi:U3 small nucleolar RNA-associated protein 15 [Neolecta irregularis DAH-3]|uniref:U3 small nucleolar RNA-associated protein 15 n=1 Tax=Neolecta irregularis (strain DAH-3) TaxID=1198029 RepID=A0A1U7LRP2_NEOID|nr:U3 small nucleolar RNA-associated protein 15 [Neolecta irregularis DAH-3]|eukprot:OLL25335.1 U3 small nucleolar RNA-associated protein 15 [Neolecta irregularis DAH-3]